MAKNGMKRVRARMPALLQSPSPTAKLMKKRTHETAKIESRIIVSRDMMTDCRSDLARKICHQDN